MPTVEAQANGKTYKFDFPEGTEVTQDLVSEALDSAVSNERSRDVSSNTLNAKVSQELGQSFGKDANGTFDLGTSVTQGFNKTVAGAEQVIHGAADTFAGGLDAVTLPLRLAGADIPTVQGALRDRRAENKPLFKDGGYNATKAETDVATPEILKGIIGPTFNPANLLGQIGAGLATGGAAVIKGGAAAVGATGGLISGLAAPTNANSAQEEAGQRLVGGALGTVTGGVLGVGAQKVGGLLSKQFAGVPVDAAKADLDASKGVFDQAVERLYAAMQHMQENPHPETKAAYDQAREFFGQAEKTLDKNQKLYDKAVKRYGPPAADPTESTPDSPITAEPTNPVSNPGTGNTLLRRSLPAPQDGRGTPNRPPGVTASENAGAGPTETVLLNPKVATDTVPQGQRLAVSPLITPPPPRSTATTQAYAHTPETLDVEVKRAAMLNALGRPAQEIEDVLQDVKTNPEYAAYAQENSPRLIQEAKVELEEELGVRYAKAEEEFLKEKEAIEKAARKQAEAEQSKTKLDKAKEAVQAKRQTTEGASNGKTNGVREESNPGGDKPGAGGGAQEGGQGQTKSPDAQAPKTGELEDGQSYNVTVDYQGAKTKANAFTQSFKSLEAAQDYAKTYADSPVYTVNTEVGVPASPKAKPKETKLYSGPGKIIEDFLEAASPKARYPLNDTQKAAQATARYNTADDFKYPSFLSQLKTAFTNAKDNLKPAFTNRFDEVQKLGDDQRYAVNQFFGLSTEASAYLGKLGGEIKDRFGEDPALIKELNEFLNLKRLEGRAANNKADPLLLKRYGLGNLAHQKPTADIQALAQRIGPQNYALMQEAEQEVRALITKAQDLQVETGFISAEDMQALRAYDPGFLPFRSQAKQLEELSAMVSPSGKKLGVNSNNQLFKKVTDFTQQHVDADDVPALDNLIPYMEQTVKLVRKNEVVKSVVNAPGSGAMPFTGKVVDGFTPVSHRAGGKTVETLVPTPVAKAIAHMDPVQAEMLGKFFSKTTKIQTGIATGYHFAFAIAQIVKDYPTALFQQADIAPGIIKNTPRAAYDQAKAFLTGRVSPAMQEFYEHGAGGSFVGEFRTPESFLSDTPKPRSFVEEYSPKSAAQLLIKGKIIPLVERLNTSIDNLPRQAAYEARKQKLQKLQATAKEIRQKSVQSGRNATVDFSEGGYLTKQLNVVSPFLNVAVQAPANTLAAINTLYKDHPVALAATVSLATLPDLIAWGANHRTPEVTEAWNDIPPDERERNHILILNNGKKDEITGKISTVKIPVADAYKGVRGAIIGGLQAAYLESPQELGVAAKSALQMLPGGQFLPIEADLSSNDTFGAGVSFSISPYLNTIPIFARQALELSVNKDTFTNTPILRTKGEQDVAATGSPEERRNLRRPDTRATATAVAQITGATPIEADYFLSKTVFSGGLEIVGKLSDKVLSNAYPEFAPKYEKNKGPEGIVNQAFDIAGLRRRFVDSRGGANELRSKADTNPGIARKALSGVQQNYIKREFKRILKDESLPLERQNEQVRSIVQRVEKENAQSPVPPEKDAVDLLFESLQEIAAPTDVFIEGLKKMNPQDAMRAVEKRMAQMEKQKIPDSTRAKFIEAVVDAEVNLEEPVDSTVQAAQGPAEEKAEPVQEAPAQEKAEGGSLSGAERGSLSGAERKLSVVPPAARKVTKVGPNLFKVADSKGVRTVRKEGSTYVVIG